jgi:hypothetical protein
MKIFSAILISGVFLTTACTQKENTVIYKGNAYTVYDNRVEQGKFRAVAISKDEIRSDYESPADKGYSPTIHFKFSINSRDNELPAGEEHIITLKPQNDTCVSPVILFGERYTAIDTNAESIPLPHRTVWTVKVDMSPMFEAFKKQGFYKTPTGDIISESDFKGVYIAGGSEPMTWDFENLYSREGMELSDPDKNGIYEISLTMNTKEPRKENYSVWSLSADIDAFPQYGSQQLLIDALYRMSLNELLDNIRPDGTLRAGAAWDGVWTRDISYSIYLALAYIYPDAAQKSLVAKVNNNRIIQDTGTGGAWPVSSDRMIWSVAAWELYKYTGDKEWLQYAFEVIRNSAQDDQFTLKDPTTGLFRGEQSYLDWREQSYPRWMQPADIYQSLCLGTNAVHCRTYGILAEMAAELGKDASIFQQQADSLKTAVNRHLWIGPKEYYGQYLYGGIYPILSPGIDNLGESLSILFDIASNEQARRMIARIPVAEYGATSIYPQIGEIKPYHNNAVWPFVQAFWNLASAKAENEASVTRGLGALYRAAALFTTNKELFVASTGDYSGTAVNSDKMLWSLSGNIAMIYRLFYGMKFETDGIRFTPFVPQSIAGNKRISNFNYRKAVLQIDLSGTGNRIKKFTIDNEEQAEAFFPATLTGMHTIKIELETDFRTRDSITVRPITDMPEPSRLGYQKDNNTLEILNYSPDNRYIVYLNGKGERIIMQRYYGLPVLDRFTRVAAIPVNRSGVAGFTGKPFTWLPPHSEIRIEAESVIPKSPIKGSEYSGKGFIEISKTKNRKIDLMIPINIPGQYAIDVRYANGNGPINTQNKCAIRSLFANGQFKGALVMPQRGENEWANWGYSNPVIVNLNRGGNKISIRFISPQDENMNGEINSALIDFIRLRRIGDINKTPEARPIWLPKE